MPALRAPLCCSPVAGRQKLADAQTVWRLGPPPAPLLSGTEWGTARLRIPVQVRDIRMIHILSIKNIDKNPLPLASVSNSFSTSRVPR